MYIRERIAQKAPIDYRQSDVWAKNSGVKTISANRNAHLADGLAVVHHALGAVRTTRQSAHDAHGRLAGEHFGFNRGTIQQTTLCVACAGRESTERTHRSVIEISLFCMYVCASLSVLCVRYSPCVPLDPVPSRKTIL